MTGAVLDPPDCPGPVPHPRPARVRVPDGACDSHIHVFGPQALFPFAQSRGYTPPEAPVEAYRRVQAALGLARAVIVQPSVYGTDNACTFEAARQLGGPERCRIVAVAPPGGPRDPDGWREAGVVRDPHQRRCGRRATDRPDRCGGGRPSRDLGWHVQLYLPRAALIEAVPTLLTLPTAVVIDHLGDPDPADPTGPALVALQRLLDGGRAG